MPIVPTESNRCIVLVGMPGSGKTTVGRDLAKRLGLRFVDTDHEIEARTGVKIPTIFEIEGEEFVVQGAPIRDRDRLLWQIELRPQ